MTEDKYKQARNLRREIGIIKGAIDLLTEEQNTLALPKEMWERHLAEKRAFLTGELDRLLTAFSAL